MIRLLSYIIIALAIPAAVCAQSPADPAMGQYMSLALKADSLMNAEQWTLAAEAYQTAMRLEPANGLNPLLMCNMGMCLNEAGDVEGAIVALSHARSMMPRSSAAALRRAQVFRGAGLDDEAYADLSDAIAIDSTLVEARLLRGIMALRRDSIPRAQTDFLALSALPGKEATIGAATGFALLYMAIGDYAQAIPPLSTLIENDPSDPDWRGRRALCRILSADPSGASEDLAEAMRSDPENAELFLYRAMLDRLRLRHEEAKYDSRHAITLGLDPDYVDQMMKMVP
ncbi:MAG: tetratricopeptide repeat protein [Pseudoflavonifractor sp.]|nr:tetratricopeptide repeat protein [Alloprevotella sp.]MCM1116581.1 tetratricopeptide repeat protein [Pseudoflavonifractor sp.]